MAMRDEAMIRTAKSLLIWAFSEGKEKIKARLQREGSPEEDYQKFEDIWTGAAAVLEWVLHEEIPCNPIVSNLAKLAMMKLAEDAECN